MVINKWTGISVQGTNKREISIDDIINNISDKIIKNDRIDIGELKPISRMGYDEYALINTIFSMKRPK